MVKRTFDGSTTRSYAPPHPNATRVCTARLSMAFACCLIVGSAAADGDKKAVTVVKSGDVPTRAVRHVQVVLPRDDEQRDLRATLTRDDLRYLRKPLRRHGFDIDPDTRRPLFHPPLHPYGRRYPYYPYFAGFVPRGLGFGAALEYSYIAGREYERHDARRRFNQEDMTERARRVLSNHARALRSGVELLNRGQHDRAVIALTLAARLDNGDPACRIHLAQARMAQGHYVEAGKVLRRALQLQPKLVHMQLDLDKHYPKAATFDEHIDALAGSLTEESDADAYFLLGFMEFQRDDFGAAYEAFRKADELRPKDRTTRRFLEIVKPAGR